MRMGFHWEGMRSCRNLNFSIFFCGCKPPKSIHIYFSPAKVMRFLNITISRDNLFVFATDCNRIL